MKLREYLFKDFTPCSNHDCVIRKPKGMGTNGKCSCLLNLSRSQLMLLSNRLKRAADRELETEL